MTPHESVPGLPGYSSAGALAGMTSVIAFSTPEDCVNGWMGSFFHRIPLLHPEAKSVGVGYALSADMYVKGTGKIALLSVPKPNRKPAKKSVVLYPAPGSKGVPRIYGVESPNAVTKPEKLDDRGLALAGFPLTATFSGYDKITKASATLYVKKGDGWKKIPAYVSTPESPAQPFFGDNMQSICAMAKDALRPETDYRVEFRATLDDTEWRGEIAFRTGPKELLHQEK